jgi:hypothetical protein
VLWQEATIRNLNPIPWSEAVTYLGHGSVCLDANLSTIYVVLSRYFSFPLNSVQLYIIVPTLASQ